MKCNVCWKYANLEIVFNGEYTSSVMVWTNYTFCGSFEIPQNVMWYKEILYIHICFILPCFLSVLEMWLVITYLSSRWCESGRMGHKVRQTNVSFNSQLYSEHQTLHTRRVRKSHLLKCTVTRTRHTWKTKHVFLRNM